MRALFLFLALAGSLHAACDQDLSFGTNGAKTYASPAGGAGAVGQELLVLSDGRMLVAGAGVNAGSDTDACWWGLDASGNQVASGSAAAMAGGTEQSFYSAAQAPAGGPVYLAGYAYDAGGGTATVIAKLNFPALTLDTSFGSNGWISMTSSVIAGAMAVDGGGLIYLANFAQLYRFQANGTLDSGFGSGGVFSFDSTAIAEDLRIDSLGRLVIAGTVPAGNATWRVLSNASMDASFASGGKRLYASASTNSGWTAAVIDPGDGVAVVGQNMNIPTTSSYVAGRYDSAGSPAFEVQGNTVNSAFGQVSGRGLLLDGAGMLVLGQKPSGVLIYPALWRLGASGALDTSFASGGERVLTATTGSMLRAVGVGTDGFATGSLGTSMALWRFSGCAPAGAPTLSSTPTPTQTATPNGTSTFTPTPTPSPSATQTVTPGAAQTGNSLPAGASDRRVVFYPQPAKDGVTAAFVMSETGSASLELYDERGARVASLQRDFGAGPAAWPVALTGFAPGIYFYRLELALSSGKRRLDPGKLAVMP